ncbi:MAG: DNA methyltransferase [Fidelibacterota bacterium]
MIDPFAGVGSTLIAAIKNKRNCIGIEKESQYCEICKNRIDELREGTLKIRPINKPVHKPSENDKVARIPKEWLAIEKNGYLK